MQIYRPIFSFLFLFKAYRSLWVLRYLFILFYFILFFILFFYLFIYFIFFWQIRILLFFCNTFQNIKFSKPYKKKTRSKVAHAFTCIYCPLLSAAGAQAPINTVPFFDVVCCVLSLPRSGPVYAFLPAGTSELVAVM